MGYSGVFADGLWRCLSAQAVSGLASKRGENPYSLERLESMEVPVCSHTLTLSPLISSWHWSLAWFISHVAKLLEILPFMHFQRLGSQWEQSTAMATGQMEVHSQLLPTAHWGCQASTHKTLIVSTQRPVCSVVVAVMVFAEILWVQKHEIGNDTADESAALVHRRGRAERAHHLRRTENPGSPAHLQQQPEVWLFPSSGKRVRTGRSFSARPSQGVGQQAQERVASGLSHSKQGHTSAIAPYSERYDGELLLW